MAIEIERKFLVTDDSWRRHPGVSRRLIQWYISDDPDRTVRVRYDSGQYILCIKGRAEGLSRIEVETTLSLADGTQLMALKAPGTSIIDKTRTLIVVGGVTWEVDEFHGDNGGLVIAEVELESEDQKIVYPFWIGQEVSTDWRYTNASLSSTPFQKWQQ